MNENDRRVRRTKAALYTELVRMLKTMELHSITVRAICENADIHRATFYYHYSDIYDLYEELENMACDAFASKIHTVDIHNYTEVFQDVVQYIAEHADVWTVLLNAQSIPSFRNRVTEILKEKYFEIIRYEIGRQDLPAELDFLSHFTIPGWVSLISYWLEKGMPYSQEDLSRMLQEIDMAADSVIIKYLEA